jgi:hypothetical protein
MKVLAKDLRPGDLIILSDVREIEFIIAVTFERRVMRIISIVYNQHEHSIENYGVDEKTEFEITRAATHSKMVKCIHG